MAMSPIYLDSIFAIFLFETTSWTDWIFSIYFKLGFYRLLQAEKSSSNWEKIQFIKLSGRRTFQTGE